MDTRLLKILEKEAEKEKTKKKKPLLSLRKEKRLMYYSGWSKGKSAESGKQKEEVQKKL